MLARFRSRAVLATSWLFVAVATPLAAEAADATYTFNIPEESLADALRAIGHQTTMNIVFEPQTVDDAQSPAIRGNLTVEQAVTRALSKTRLQARQATANSILIEALSTNVTSRQRFLRANDLRTATADPPGTRAAQMDEGATETTGVVGSSDSTTPERGSLEEVIVTAQKKEERLKDVPVPVSVINAGQLEEMGQVRLFDYISSVPGVTMNAASGNGYTIAIRGLTNGFVGGSGNAPEVGYMVDGIPLPTLTNNDHPDLDPANLQRVEVLRGPQGTLFGDYSEGGLINFVTNSPSPAGFFGRLQTGFSTISNGAEPGFTLRAMANSPITDTLAVRASGSVRRDPGYIDNILTGQNGINDTEARSGNISLGWQPNRAFSLKLNALYDHADTPAEALADATLGTSTLEQRFLHNTGDHTEDTALFSSTIDVALGAAKLTSLTGYVYHKNGDVIDLTAALSADTYNHYGVDGSPVWTGQTDRQFSEELRASLAINKAIDGLVGFFYLDDRARYFSTFGAQDIAAVQAIPGAIQMYYHEHHSLEELAAFSTVTVRPTDRLSIQIGGRETFLSQLDGLDAEGLSPQTSEALVFYHADPYAPADLRSRPRAFTYLFTPSYKFTPDVMGYVRLASGFRPGGANNPAAGVPSTFSPDETRNYEIGLKGDFLDRRLTIDASLYYIRWTSIQFTITNSSSSAFYTGNAGRAKSQGLELSAAFRPVEDLSLSAWIDFSNAVFTTAPQSVLDAGTFIERGDRLPFSERFSAHAAIDRDFRVSDTVRAFVGGEFTYVGSQLGPLTDSSTRQVFPGYAKVGLRAGFKVENWTVNAYVDNLADKRGVIGGGIGTLTPTYFRYITPRTVGMNVARSF